MNTLQQCILEIFKDIAALCNANDIPYFAIGGTCLGAVRHKGFIPWDDDLDIAIPIEDFEIFAELVKEKLPGYLQIYTSKEVKRYRYIFNKVIDTRTTFIEKSEVDYPDAYKGVFVDVMPISGVPKPGIKRKLFYIKLYLYTHLNLIIRVPLDYSTILKRFVARFIGLILKVLPSTYFSDKMMALLKKYPFKTSQYTGYVWSVAHVCKLTFPIEYFADTVELPFEDTTIKCPIGYKQYLTHQFGDYMELPPEEEREHHNGIINLDRPYSDYQADQSLLEKELSKQKQEGK
ncbi:MAG: LicD family protein [Lachnospiraceae bacterium]|nr:LicD family protein [Lachnospiraceae bacterium]